MQRDREDTGVFEGKTQAECFLVLSPHAGLLRVSEQCSWRDKEGRGLFN